MDARVAVVGAGPAGALLSYLLASRGIDTLLIERQSDFAREFRGELLMPSGIRALESAGFDLASVATRRPGEIKAFMNGRPFLTLRPAELAVADSEEPLPTAVSQPELLEALVKKSQATAHFELRRGTTVRRISSEIVKHSVAPSCCVPSRIASSAGRRRARF